MSEMPQEWVDKAARVVFNVVPAHDDTRTWDEIIAHAVLTAALPDVREAIARDIEDAGREPGNDYSNPSDTAIHFAMVARLGIKGEREWWAEQQRLARPQA